MTVAIKVHWWKSMPHHGKGHSSLCLLSLTDKDVGKPDAQLVVHHVDNISGST